MKAQIFTLGPLSVAYLDEASRLGETEFVTIPEAELKLAGEISHPERRGEFLKGRWLLHTLNPKLGPILKNEHGMPLWPDGIKGSIAHKHGHVVVVTSLEKTFPDLGIDIELPRKVSPSIQSHVCHDKDLSFFTCSQVPANEMLSLIFSAKESLFKYCYPRAQTWFGFQDARLVTCDWSEKSFSLQLLKALPAFPSGSMFRGSFEWIESSRERFLVTGLWDLAFPFKPSFLSPDCARTQGNSPHLS